MENRRTNRNLILQNNNQQQKGWKKMMIKETFEGEYIIDDKAFDDIYVFLDIDTYLYRAIQTRFAENRNLEYLVSMQNKAIMVLENNQMIFGMKMTELTKKININKPNGTVYRYSLEIEIHVPEYKFILEAVMLFLEKSTDEREDKKIDYKI